jgi:Rho GTPase-activating protein RGD1
MSDHGLQFAMSLHQMSDDLLEMASNIERGRKHWKHTGLSSEQRLQDAEAAMGKAKTKYDTLAEQYDRARTGDRQSGRFALKTKSAAQQEEDLHRKVQAADAEYASRVQAARASRQELVTSLRPQAVRALTELIMECDSGLALQLQKYASLNEKLLLGNGLCVSPLKNQPNGMTPESRSLREVAHNIDNEKDFRDYVLSFSNKAGTRTSEIKYEKHPALSSPKQVQPPSQLPQQSFNNPVNVHQNPSPVAPNPSSGYERGHRPSQSGQISGVTPYQPPNRDAHPTYFPQSQYPSGNVPPNYSQPPHYLGAQIPDIPPHSPITFPGTNIGQSDALPSNIPATFGTSDRMRSDSGSGPGPVMTNTNQYQEDFHPRPPQGPNNHFRSISQSQPPSENFSPIASHQNMPVANISQPRRNDGTRNDLPPLNPVFGVTLDELFRRDGTAVPPIIHQCTVAVELFGLDVEGIYRTSGSNPHIMEMKAMFDNGRPFTLRLP